MCIRDRPWITKGLLTSIKIRDNLFREYLSVSSTNIKAFLHTRYKFYRNRIVFLIRLSKKLHYTHYFHSNSNNLRKIRLGVRGIISWKSTNSPFNISLKLKNSITSDPSTVSEFFNDFFSTIADKVRSKIPFTRHHFSDWLKKSNRNSFFTSPTSPLEVSDILCSLNSRKASGPFSLPNDMISIVLYHLSNILSNIILFLLRFFQINLKRLM